MAVVHIVLVINQPVINITVISVVGDYCMHATTEIFLAGDEKAQKRDFLCAQALLLENFAQQPYFGSITSMNEDTGTNKRVCQKRTAAGKARMVADAEEADEIRGIET